MKHDTVLGSFKDDQTWRGCQVVHFQPCDSVHKRTKARVKCTDGKEFKATEVVLQRILELSTEKPSKNLRRSASTRGVWLGRTHKVMEHQEGLRQVT